MDVVIAILVLLVLLSMLGASFSAITKDSKLPTWAKFDYRKYWGTPGTPICDWLNRSEWLKIILIKLVQLAIIVFLFLFNFTLVVAKTFIKALGHGVKSAAKKAIK